MIDIEQDVFKKVASSVRKKYPKAYVTPEYIRAPPRFPSVSVEEKNNATDTNTIDSGSNENTAILMYEVNVYSNKIEGKKAECKAIAALADEAMLDMGFERIMMQPIPNLDDATIYRMTARYTAVADREKNIYGR